MSVQNVRSFTMLECVAYTEAFNTTEVATDFCGVAWVSFSTI